MFSSPTFVIQINGGLLPISVSFGADRTVEDAAKCAPNGSFGRLWDDQGNKEMKNDAKIGKVSKKSFGGSSKTMAAK